MTDFDPRTVVIAATPTASRRAPSRLALLALALLGGMFATGCSNKPAGTSNPVPGTPAPGQPDPGQLDTPSGQPNPDKPRATPGGGWDALFADPPKKPGKAEDPKDDEDPVRPKRFASKGPADVLQDPLGHAVLNLSFTPDSRVLATIDATGYATLWDVKSRRGVDVSFTSLVGGMIYPGQLGPVSARYLVISPDGSTLIFGTSHRVNVVDLPSGKGRWTKGIQYQSSWPLCVSPSAKYVAMHDHDENSIPLHSVTVYEVASGKEVCKLSTGENAVGDPPLAFSPDDKLAALYEGLDQRMRIISLPDGKDAGTIKGLNNVYEFTFTADSSGLLLPGELQLWDLSRPDQPKLALNIQPNFTKKSASKVYSPDSKTLAVTNTMWDGEKVGGTIVWDIEKRGERFKLAGLASAAFSADSRRIAGVLTFPVTPEKVFPAKVLVADAVTGKTLATIDSDKIGSGKFGRGSPTCVALSPDGKLVAIGTTDGRVVLRPATDGR